MANFVSFANISFLTLLALISCSSGSATSFDTEEDGAVASSKVQHTAPPKVVKLERQSVILPKTAVRAGKRKNFYSAKIMVGEPAQEFHVAFDLGGGTMMLPSKDCTDPACLERRLYNKWKSHSAADIQADGRLVQPKVPKTLLQRRDRGTVGIDSIDVGAGKVMGTFVREKVCIVSEDLSSDDAKEARCFPLAMLVAKHMSGMPFLLEPYDGTVGLGLKGLSLNQEFNFLSAFQKGYGAGQGMFSNSFGLHIGSDGDGGEITFGGYDLKRLSQPLEWAPVAKPQEGRWQVSISAIRVGNKTLEACRDHACIAAIDYSSSLLGVPTKIAKGVETVLGKLAPPEGFGNGCQYVAIPDLHLELENNVTLSLPAEDFVSEFGSRSEDSCNPLLTHHETEEAFLDVFILGESTLRRYYTFFNADTLAVGFSLAAGSAAKSVPSLPGNKGKKTLEDEDPVILLVQVRLLKSKTVSSLGL